MRIPKCFLSMLLAGTLSFSFAAFGADPVIAAKPARAIPDSDSQARAREAMRQALAQSATNVTTPAPPQKAEPKSTAKSLSKKAQSVQSSQAVAPSASTRNSVTPPPSARPIPPAQSLNSFSTAPVTSPEGKKPKAEKPRVEKAKAEKPKTEKAKLEKPKAEKAKVEKMKPQKAATIAESKPAATQTPVVTPPRADSEAIARAREAMRQKMGGVSEPESTQVRRGKQKSEPKDAAKAKPQKPVKEAKVVEKPATKQKPVQETKAKETPVKMAKVQEIKEPKPAPPAKPAKEAKAKPVKETASKKETAKPAKTVKQTAVAPAPAFQKMPAPPSSVSGDKQQRLSDLLQKYRSDEITPAQYHQERAKILGEP